MKTIPIEISHKANALLNEQMPLAQTDEDLCSKVWDNDFAAICTRIKGHDGLHVGVQCDDHIVAIWAEEECK